MKLGRLIKCRTVMWMKDGHDTEDQKYFDTSGLYFIVDGTK